MRGLGPLKAAHPLPVCDRTVEGLDLVLGVVKVVINYRIAKAGSSDLGVFE